MKNYKRMFVGAALLAAFSLPVYAAQTSTVNPTQPAQNSPLLSSVLRAQFLAAYNDITSLFALIIPAANNLVGSLNGLTAANIPVPNCSSASNALGWVSGGGFICNTISVSGGLLAANNLSDVASVPTSRTNLGLGTASTPSFGGLTVTGIAKVNLNATALPTPQTGTVLQIGDLDGSVTRAELQSFGAGSHFTAIRSDGTNASPTTLQANDLIGSFNAYGFNGSALVGPMASVQMYANQNWGVGSNGSYVTISTTPNGSATLAPVLRFENDGGMTTPGVTGGDKGAGTINAAGLYINGALVSTSTGGGGGAGSPVLLPRSVSLTDTVTGGNIYPSFYTGAGVNVAATESGITINNGFTSAGADPVLSMRFKYPPSLPTGSAKIVSDCISAAAGTLKYTVSDAAVASGSSPSSASLSAEAQTTITPGIDTYLTTATTITSTPVANSIAVVAVTFNRTGSSLTNPVTCSWSLLWQ